MARWLVSQFKKKHHSAYTDSSFNFFFQFYSHSGCLSKDSCLKVQSHIYLSRRLTLKCRRTSKMNHHKNTVACNYLFTHMTKACSADQSKFKVYPPTLERFGATPQTFEQLKGSKVDQQRVRVFCVFRMNETPVFDLDAYSTLLRKTLTHILPFSRCKLCDFVHEILILQRWLVFSSSESCVFYLGWGFFKFFSFAFASPRFPFLAFFPRWTFHIHACLSEKKRRSFSRFTQCLLVSVLDTPTACAWSGDLFQCWGEDFFHNSPTYCKISQ